MDDTEDYDSVNDITKSHQDSEGVSIRNTLYMKVLDLKDIPFVARHKMFFKEYLTPKVVAFFWIWFGVQFVIAPLLGIELGSQSWRDLFLLSPENFYSVALFTNIIGHGSLLHVLVNSVVFYSFGIKAEQVLEPYEYILFFIVSGVAAGVMQIGLPLVLELGTAPAIIGASGAISGFIGLVAVKEPDLKIYLLFAIPMKMWKGVTLFLIGSTLAVVIWGAGAGGFGHIAHITGAVLGILVGLIIPGSIDSIDLSPFNFK